MGDIKELSCLVNGQLHCKNKNVNCILKQTHVGVRAKLFIVCILVPPSFNTQYGKTNY